MGMDVAYCNLQAMQKMKEVLKTNMAYYAKGINYTHSENNYKEMQRVSYTYQALKPQRLGMKSKNPKNKSLNH